MTITQLHHHPQLITYPDSLGGDLAALGDLFSAHLADAFPGGVHILPPFPSSGDRGFAPIDYSTIDPAFGTWEDVARIGAIAPVTLDLMVNHVSRRSAVFEDFVRWGRRSRWADLFITLDKIWPGGVPDADDVAKIFLRKPEHPFSDVTITETGEIERIWTSFGPRVDWSEQIDLDVHSPLAEELFRVWFDRFAAHGVTTVRLDAVGYVTKQRGTSCFMVEPAIWDFLDEMQSLASSFGLAILPEVHDEPATFHRIAEAGYTTYNFVLPGVVLEALLSGRSDVLVEQLRRCPSNQVTMLDCHDGIPVQPDLVGVLSQDRLRGLVGRCVERGANVNRILGAPPGSFDAHQLNLTYASACGGEERYLTARAIQVFAPGTPQVYYVGLLGGQNDLDAVVAQGEGRAINRHDYTRGEIESALGSEVVRRQLALLRLRAEHPAFGGTFEVDDIGSGRFVQRWRAGSSWCALEVDVVAGSHEIRIG